MTMATAFPASLPQPLRMAYGYSVENPHAGTMNERGLSRRRRIGIGSTTTATLTWHFTPEELQTFAQWWRDDIAYGTADFTISLLNGYDYAAQDVRARSSYSSAKMNGAWEVSLAVEMLEMPIASQSVMQDAIDNYEALSFINEFHYLIHITVPENL